MSKPELTIYDEEGTVTPEMWETGLAIPGAKLKMAKAPDEPAYRRFECMDGPLAGRGLIVPMPASRVAGYNLYHTETGAHVAYHADLLA